MGGGNLHAELMHQHKQPQGFKRNRLSPRIGTGDDEL